MSARKWHELGAKAPTELNDERLQLHWAAQPLSALAHTAIERQPDDSHTNLGWDHETAAFVSREFAGGYTAALLVNDFALQWREADGTPLARFQLKGQTLDAALGWLTELVRPAVGDFPDGPVPLRDFDMPKHRAAEGQPFSGGEKDRRAELARWYACADVVLAEIAENHEESTAPRTWPHHFDSGLLIRLEPDKDPEQARSIGAGMSPGDGNKSQPYFYVYPYPRPAGDVLPKLPSGAHWEDDAFFGAVLSGDVLVAGDPAGQHERVREFLDAAIEASRGMFDL